MLDYISWLILHKNHIKRKDRLSFSLYLQMCLTNKRIIQWPRKLFPAFKALKQRITRTRVKTPFLPELNPLLTETQIKTKNNWLEVFSLFKCCHIMYKWAVHHVKYFTSHPFKQSGLIVHYCPPFSKVIIKKLLNEN